MTGIEKQEYAPGDILEFYEDKELVCGLCLAVKEQRLQVLTPRNREINMARNRVLLNTNGELNQSQGRENLIKQLAEISEERRKLAENIPVRDLWELLEGEEEGFYCQEMAEMVYSSTPSAHQVAAVLRAILADPFYFKYRDRRFFANSPEKIEQIKLCLEREAERKRQLEEGSEWLRAVWQRKRHPEPECKDKIIRLLKEFCILGKDASEYSFTREILSRAQIPTIGGAFRILVRLGEWQENENLFFYKYDIATSFEEKILQFVQEIKKGAHLTSPIENREREDLRSLDLITIDGALTRDYDDALNLRELEDGIFEVGIHIADTAHYVKPHSLLDEAALSRATSIYLPDTRIPMLPPDLSEEICSLWARKDRLAVSLFVRLTPESEILDFRLVPSLVQVKRQLTYTDVNLALDGDTYFQTLFHLAKQLRKRRIAEGASIIYIPELRIWVNSEGMIHVNKHEEETASQIIVSEFMVLANSLTARYFAERSIPTIYRSQCEPRPEDRPGSSDNHLFQKYRQRRLLPRAELSTDPQPHCGVGVPCYTSVTSPIRRYIDLVVQRQLKHHLEKGEPFYSEAQLQDIINRIQEPQSNAMAIRRSWTRYWTLKYLEQENITVTEALVLDQGSRFYKLLLTHFMLEATMKSDPKRDIVAGDTIKIKIERIHPREDIMKLSLL